MHKIKIVIILLFRVTAGGERDEEFYSKNK